MLPGGTPLCGRIRVNEVESIAVGAQTVPYVCPDPATVAVVDEHDEQQLACPHCAGKIADAADAAQLRLCGDRMVDLATGMARHPEVAQWLATCAGEIHKLAQELQSRSR